MAIPASLLSEFSLTPAGTKKPPQVNYLPEIGIHDKKTHSSSIDVEHAELVRKYFAPEDQVARSAASNQVRINELARDLDVKARAVLDYLPEIGIADKKTHSSSIDVEHAELVCKHFAPEDQVARSAASNAIAISTAPHVPILRNSDVSTSPHSTGSTSSPAMRASLPADNTSVVNSASQSVARLLASEGNAGLGRQRKPSIFLCYARSDRYQVEQLFEKLQGDGFEPWMDKRSLLPGQDWKLEIRRAIEAADFFIACISRSFRDRTYGHKEIKLALDVLDTMPEGTIYLIPLRLEDCPVENRLASRHWVDLFASGGYQLLLQALRSRVQ